MVLRLAVQAKGRLFDDTMSLLHETGIKLESAKRLLLVSATNFPLEVLFLRDDDIPQSVADGIADIGIVGENEFVEKRKRALIVKAWLEYRLSLAIPKGIDYPGIHWFDGKPLRLPIRKCWEILREKKINADIT